MPVLEKAIVTNMTALRAKYGARTAEVKAAVGALVRADARRGITSRLVAIDSARDMGAIGAAPVDGLDRRAAKEAIDAIDAAYEPAYLLILGGPDVVPLQELRNPLAQDIFGDEGDDDRTVPSDLPYACDAGYSTDPRDFMGPVRVVGRLPDLPRARSPGYLVRLLRYAAQARPLPRRDYERWFALTAQSWLGATRTVLERVYGPVRRSEMHVSPGVRDGALTAAKLAGRMHYVNCHGGPFEASFQGEMELLPLPRTEALATRDLAGKVPRGAVLAVECCYGTHIFDPNDRRAGEPGRLGIALEYLRQGAHAVFGSSNTAYGGIYDVEHADLLCARFMQRVLAGASLGRAVLEARQDFLAFTTSHDPTQLKTLAQFCLLGDPSIHPVRRELDLPGRRVRDPFTRAEARRLSRRLSRENLWRMGSAILSSAPLLGITRTPSVRQAHRAVGQVARALGYSDRDSVGEAIRIFDLSIGAALRAPIAGGQGAGVRRVVVGMRTILDRHHVVIAQVEGSNVLSIREAVSH